MTIQFIAAEKVYCLKDFQLLVPTARVQDVRAYWFGTSIYLPYVSNQVQQFYEQWPHHYLCVIFILINLICVAVSVNQFLRKVEGIPNLMMTYWRHFFSTNTLTETCPTRTGRIFPRSLQSRAFLCNELDLFLGLKKVICGIACSLLLCSLLSLRLLTSSPW